jgi:hypothetical protein
MPKKSADKRGLGDSGSNSQDTSLVGFQGYIPRSPHSVNQEYP